MSISSVNSSTLKMSGLASGLDTEELVKQMSAASKARINSQQQKMDLLQWKQEAYRTTISSITTFKDTYFNLLKPKTNLSSTSLFGTRSVTSTNSSLKVSASSNATEATYNITNVIKQAQNAEIASTSKAVDGINIDFATTEGEDYTFNFDLDGLTKEITFTGGTTGTGAGSTQQNLLDALGTAFSSSNAVFSMDGSDLKVSDSVYSSLNHVYEISALSSTDTTGLTALGLTGTTSSKLSLNTKLEDVVFGNELKGNGFTFNINGEEFKFDKSQTISNVINTINDSDAGVKLSYDNIGGKFKMEATESGLASSIKISQTSGNLLTSMFGAEKIAESTYVSSQTLMSNGIEGVTPVDGEGFGFEDGVSGDISELINQKINVTVNGVEKTIGLWSYDASGNKNDFSKSSNVLYQLNSQLSKNFTADTPVFSYDSNSKTFTLTAANAGDEVSIATAEDTTGGSQKLLTALGFDDSNSTNIIDLDHKLFDGVTGTIDANISFGTGFNVHLDNNSTIRDLVEGSNGNMTYENGYLTLRGVDYNCSDEAGKAYLSSLFGESYNYPGLPPTEIIPTFESNGENAIITVNGNTITSNSNSFTIDGTTLDISGLSVGATDISATTTSDTTDAVATIKAFAEDYNKLMDELNKTTSTSYNKDYPPLTEKQRNEMSDKEIETWEEKAKTGLLYQDSTINKVITQLRSSVSGFSAFGTSLYNMGIKVSSNYMDNGKLEINETALTKALSEDPDAISKFFTDSTNGLANAVTTVLNNAVKSSGASKGSLVLIAGVENTSTVIENRISKQLESYQEIIDSLQDKYESEQDRYWTKFNTLEGMMSSYNSQSEWLAQQFTS